MKRFAIWFVHILLALFLIVLIYFRFFPLDFRTTDKELNKKLMTTADVPVNYVHVGDSLSYIIAGNRVADTTVLFIHGTPGSADNFLPYLTLKKLNKYKLISVDRPGFGWSDFGTLHPQLIQQCKPILHLIQLEKIQNIILVSHSYGGAVALKIQTTIPAKIIKNILIAASVSAELEPDSHWRKLIDNTVFNWILPTPLRVCNQEIIALKKELVILKKDLKKIQSPVISIHGDHDRLVSVDNVKFLSAHIAPHLLNPIVLSNENHFILWTKVEFISDLIL